MHIIQYNKLDIPVIDNCNQEHKLAATGDCFITYTEREIVKKFNYLSR